MSLKSSVRPISYDARHPERVVRPPLQSCWTSIRPAGERRQDRILAAAEPLTSLQRDHADAQAEDSYVITTEPDVKATLVNVVFLSKIVSAAATPTASDAPPAPPPVSLAALYQSLVGVACFGFKTNGNLEVALRSRAPFRAKHSFTPGDMRLQETAATSDLIGHRVLLTTLNLISRALGPGVSLRAHNRQRTNEVYTAYLPFRLDLERIQQALPKLVTVPDCIVGLIIETSDKMMKLLLFPKGIAICVGSKHYTQMQQAMRRYMPDFLSAAIVDETQALPAARPQRKRKAAS